MKKILFGLLFICSIARAQTDDSTRYLRYPTQYGMRMPRGWFDSVLHLPYGDSARFRSSKNGAVMMHTSGDVVKWYNNKWNLLGGGTSQNFANTDLTLTGNRSHSFGTNEMRFNFTGLGLLGDGYVAFNQDNIPGIVIQGDDDYIGGTIKFRSLANPSATTTISNFYGTIQMRSRVGVNQGFADIGDEQTWIGVDKGVAGLVKEIGFTRAAYKGINLRDGIDTTGAFYDANYITRGIENHGDRWIPDWGAVLGVVGSGTPIPAGRLSVGTGTGTTSYSPLNYTDSTQRLSSPIAHHGVHTQVGDTVLQKTYTQTGIFYGHSYIAGTTINPAYLRLSTGIANLTGVFELNRGIGSTRLVAATGSDSSMENRIYTIPAKTAAIKYILFAYGVNDALALVDTATYRSVYNRVIDTCIARGYALNEIGVLSIAYFVDANPTIQARIEQIFDIEKHLTSVKGVLFVDNYNTMVANGGQKLLLSDNVHLNDRGNEVWINNAVAVIKGGGTIRVNGYLNTNAITVYQVRNPTNAPFMVGVDTSLQTVLEFRAKRIGTNTESIALGVNAMESLTSGTNNTALGAKAMQSTTTGAGNIAAGYNALNANVAGGDNVAIGMNAGRVTTSSNNIFIGRDAGYSNTTGTQNTSIGYEAGKDNSTGSFNTSLGAFALNENTGSNNSAFGVNSLRNNNGGGNNTGVGFNALFNNASGSGNTAIGYRAARGATGSDNTVVGTQAGDSLSSGIRNCFISYRAGYRTKTGQLNTYIGYQSGLNNEAGSYNTYIGGHTGLAGDLSRQIIIATGEGAVALHGEMNSGRIGIGTIDPQYGLHIARKVAIDSIATASTLDSILVVNDKVVEKASIAALKTALGIGDVLSYTPSITTVSNIASVTPTTTYYQVVNGSCEIWGYITVSTTATGTANFRMTLPVATTFSDFSSLAGNFNTHTVSDNGGIYPDISNNEATFQWSSSTTSSNVFRFRIKTKITPP